ncbi:flagellar basal body-associated FliL family protein [Methylocystis sp. JAN1]|uniref:flagellar basal body-associated FliL family protein n=1 Tax=Methylocystis sp. JAN1 TaxID=3397211 RepID=UPI003FA22AA2
MAGKSGDAENNRKATDFVLPLTIVTIIGGAGGGLLGASILPGMNGAIPPAETPAQVETSAPLSGTAHGGAHGEAVAKNARTDGQAPAAALEVRELPPIVTNLSGAGRQLIRLQSAILYNPKELQQVDVLLASLRSDIVSFLGTLDLSAVEGADGLRRLQEELRERASTRSEGHIRELIIETLVIQ